MALLAASPQAVAQQRVLPEPQQLDSVQQRYHDALWTLRDSVIAVRAAIAGFQRDLSRVSPETVESRAATLRTSCAAAARALERHGATFRPDRAPARPPLVRPRAADVSEAIAALRSSLERQCVAGFAARGPGQWPDTLRAWGGYRGGQIESAIRRYESAAAEFARAAEFKLEAKTSSR